MQEALEIYSKQMRIDKSFRDIKSFLLFEKIMNKKQINMKKMIALVLLAYTIGLLLGEGFLDRMYEGRKWHRYLGLFIPLKQKIRLSREVLAEVINDIYLLFMRILLCNVRTYV